MTRGGLASLRKMQLGEACFLSAGAEPDAHVTPPWSLLLSKQIL